MQVFHIILICVLFAIIGYLLGSILFGEIIAKIKKVNIREKGSKNIGATNTLRLISPYMGIVVVLLDAAKSYLAIIISWLIFYYTICKWTHNNYLFYCLIYISGFFAVVGHCFPALFVYKLLRNEFNLNEAKKYIGGKGMSCMGGIFISVSPYIFLVCFTTWMIIFLIWRYASLGSIICNFVSSVMVFFKPLDLFYLFGNNLYENDLFFVQKMNDDHLFYQMFTILFVILFISSIISLLRHSSNIKRLITKQEKKIF